MAVNKPPQLLVARNQHTHGQHLALKLASKLLASKVHAHNGEPKRVAHKFILRLIEPWH